MLGYLTTDAKIAPALLRKVFGPTVDASFNAVTIDDHTSTNDTAVLLASGAGATVAGDRDVAKFKAALDEVWAGPAGPGGARKRPRGDS